MTAFTVHNGDDRVMLHIFSHDFHLLEIRTNVNNECIHPPWWGTVVPGMLGPSDERTPSNKELLLSLCLISWYPSWKVTCNVATLEADPKGVLLRQVPLYLILLSPQSQGAKLWKAQLLDCFLNWAVDRAVCVSVCYFIRRCMEAPSASLNRAGGKPVPLCECGCTCIYTCVGLPRAIVSQEGVA